MVAIIAVATIGMFSSCSDDDNGKSGLFNDILTFKNIEHLRNLSIADATKEIKDAGFLRSNEQDAGDIFYKKTSEYFISVEILKQGFVEVGIQDIAINGYNQEDENLWQRAYNKVNTLVLTKLEEEHSFTGKEPNKAEIKRESNVTTFSKRQEAVDYFRNYLLSGDGSRYIRLNCYYDTFVTFVEIDDSYLFYGIMNL